MIEVDSVAEASVSPFFCFLKKTFKVEGQKIWTIFLRKIFFTFFCSLLQPLHGFLDG